MNQKTVRYGSGYRISADGTTLETLAHDGNLGYEWRTTIVHIGAELVLVSRTAMDDQSRRLEGRGTRYHLAAGPVEGNSWPTVTRYHGWRGTTNNVSVRAYGLRRVLAMRTLRDGSISVRVGRDLHPDWE